MGITDAVRLLLAGVLVVLLHTGATLAAAGRQAEPTFRQIDSNRDGALSQQELIDVGQDDLTFRAMDIDGDGRVDQEEFAQRRQLDKLEKQESKPASVSPPH